MAEQIRQAGGEPAPDGDQLESLEQVEPDDGYRPPADPWAEPAADGGE